MFKRNLGYLGGTAVAVAFSAYVAACGGGDSSSPPPADAGLDASTAPVDGSTPPGDSGSTTDASGTTADAAADAATPDAGLDGSAAFPCSGGKPLPIFGNYLASDGTTHWLRQSASAATYSRIPAGAPASKSPPSLWLITQVCSDQQVFVAQSETSTYARVDFAQSGDSVQVCVASQGAADPMTALAAPVSVPGSATGCQGSTWTTLSKLKTDGGL